MTPTPPERVKCPDCRGSGFLYAAHRCPTCSGTGEVPAPPANQVSIDSIAGLYAPVPPAERRATWRFCTVHTPCHDPDCQAAEDFIPLPVLEGPLRVAKDRRFSDAFVGQVFRNAVSGIEHG